MTPNETAPRWKNVAHQIRDAIRSGRLRPGDRLAAGSADAAAWATSHPTLRSALRDLASTGELDVLARGFRVPYPVLRSTEARVLWIAACDLEGHIVGESGREERLRRHFDLACRRRGLHLRVAGFSAEGRLFLEGESSSDLAGVLDRAYGSVLCPWRMGPEVEGIAEVLAVSRRPAAVWAEGGMGKPFPAGSRACLFDNAHHSGQAGSGMGAHLRDLGHRRITYVSVYHGTEWSRRRLEGLRSVLRPCGGHVRALCTASIRHPLERRTELTEEIVQGLDALVIPHHAFLAATLSDVRSRLRDALREREVLEALLPLLEQAMADRMTGSTAWVFSNDEQAILAMRWLRKRGVRIPQEISIAGFDDCARGQDLGLTSWSFAESELAEAMVHHLTRPGNDGKMVRIRGSVVPRGTTSRRSS